MATCVRAVYDFVGESGTTELSITAGEVLTVTSTDVGEGWWEGKNSKGEIGLFPAAYVEVMSKVEVQNTVQATTDGGHRYDQSMDDWDDDWDDDDYSTIPARTTGETASVSNSIYDRNLPVVPYDEGGNTPSNNMTTLKRAGMFGRSCDAYILGSMPKEKLPDCEMVKIIQAQQQNCYQWYPQNQNYTVVVDSPKKETKFKGMKTYIAYQLTPSFNNISVARRYKHFDWLHERLVEKFCLIPIPPLPDKQISGRYEEQFVEHRRVQLQEFVDWMCRHPVLSNCEVWQHFLTCTDERIWKSGKRKAERDSYVGVTYCWAITTPEKQLMPSDVEPQIEGFSQFIHSMEIAIKNLLAISNETTKRYQIQCKKEFQRIGDGLSELAKALYIDERRSSALSTGPSLSDSVGRIGGIFIGMGQLFGDQPKMDWIPLCDRLHIYRGVLNSFPEIMSNHKGAIQKRKECERLTADQKMNSSQMIEVNRRTDVMTYAVLAEMSHFKEERETHLKQTLKSLIEEQIKFYKTVVSRLEDAYRQFD